MLFVILNRKAEILLLESYGISFKIEFETRIE
jgi:hypothetical protein